MAALGEIIADETTEDSRFNSAASQEILFPGIKMAGYVTFILKKWAWYRRLSNNNRLGFSFL